MKPEHEQYIIENLGRKSAKDISEDLGIKERKIKRFLDRQKEKQAPSNGRGVLQCTPSLSISRKNILLSVVLIVLLGFAVYGNSIGGAFIWDDTHLVEDNLYIRSWSNWTKLFVEPMGAGADAATVYSFYRPLQMITYMLDYSFWKLDPRGYHFTNILLHVFASLSVFWLINLLYKDWKLSLLTGLFFVSHPIHTEAISYIAGRADSLVVLFMLLCFIFYIKTLQYNKKSYYVLMAASYVLAVFSKEFSLILPFLLLLYHYTFRQKVKPKIIFPIVAISAFYIIARFTILSFLSSHIVHKTTFVQRAAGFFIAIINYIKIMILPLNLHMEYGTSFFDFSYPQVWVGVGAVFALIIIVAKMRPARNIIFFALAWFLICLAPTSGLLYPINAYMAEHWLYLPSVGIFLLLSKSLMLLGQEKGLKVVSMAAIVLFLGFYSFLTIDQNNYWKAPIPFYERTIKYANQSSRVYYNLGNEYRKIGEIQNAVTNYNKALKVRPDYYEAYYNLGKAYEAIPDWGKAEAAYQKVIDIEPNYGSAYYNLGNLYYESGRIQEAIGSYERVIAVDPKHIKAYGNLAVAYAAANRHEEAENLFKKSITMDPNSSISYGNLAIYYFGRQRVNEAIQYYKKAVKLGFKDPKFQEKIAPHL